MTGIAPEVWGRLSAERPIRGGLTAQRAAPESTERLIAAIDADGRRHLLVLLALSEDDFNDLQTRGLAVTTRELAVPEHCVGRYLDIVCHDIAGHDAFDLIGGELAQRLGVGDESAAASVTRVLAKWRRFWGDLPSDALSFEEQLGLFAELWFLNVWLLPRVAAGTAVARWRGPFRARHDFEWSGRSVEVKASTSTRAPIHRIHGLDQLMTPVAGDLLFFSLRLREEAGASNSLPRMVATCRERLRDEVDALLQFESTLSAAKYFAEHEDQYNKVRLRIVEEALFRVEDDFPRLTSLQITGGGVTGVERVDYEINLSGFQHLLMARSTGEAVLL